jgi:hypothetical protein
MLGLVESVPRDCGVDARPQDCHCGDRSLIDGPGGEQSNITAALPSIPTYAPMPSQFLSTAKT